MIPRLTVPILISQLRVDRHASVWYASQDDQEQAQGASQPLCTLEVICSGQQGAFHSRTEAARGQTREKRLRRSKSVEMASLVSCGRYIKVLEKKLGDNAIELPEEGLEVPLCLYINQPYSPIRYHSMKLGHVVRMVNHSLRKMRRH